MRNVYYNIVWGSILAYKVAAYAAAAKWIIVWTN